MSKLAAKHYLHTSGRHAGVETVVLRQFNVFGPGQDPGSEYAAVIPPLITAVLENRRPSINGDSSITRDFTYVDAVVSANRQAASTADVSRKTMNVACGDRISLIELLEAVFAAVNRGRPTAVRPPRAGDILRYMVDIESARRSRGYEVSIPFGSGIRMTVDRFRQERGAEEQMAKGRVPDLLEKR